MVRTATSELSPGLLETYMTRFELKKEDIMEEKAAFDQLDINGSGHITMDELKAYNSKFKAGFSDKDLLKHFKEMDADGNGGISFLEFLKVYVKGVHGREVHIGLEHIEAAVKDLQVTPRSSIRSRGFSGDDSICGLETIKEANSSPNLSGVLDFRVSRKNTVGFYIRSAKSFLRGTDGKPPVEALRVSALGDAINAAVAVAAAVEAEGLARIARVQTAYPDMPSGRGSPQIFIDVERSVPA